MGAPNRGDEARLERVLRKPQQQAALPDTCARAVFERRPGPSTYQDPYFPFHSGGWAGPRI